MSSQNLQSVKTAYGPLVIDKSFKNCIRSLSGTVIANTDNADQYENAKRFVALWNAGVYVPTRTLEDGVKVVEAQTYKDLLTALEEVTSCLKYVAPLKYPAIILNAENQLARAEGRA